MSHVNYLEQEIIDILRKDTGLRIKNLIRKKYKSASNFSTIIKRSPAIISEIYRDNRQSEAKNFMSLTIMQDITKELKIHYNFKLYFPDDEKTYELIRESIMKVCLDEVTTSKFQNRLKRMIADYISERYCSNLDVETQVTQFCIDNKDELVISLNNYYKECYEYLNADSEIDVDNMSSSDIEKLFLNWLKTELTNFY
ncbi:hypothetical protein [Streptococcus hyointestinalis]